MFVRYTTSFHDALSIALTTAQLHALHRCPQS
jgi:hypothetical protein